MFAKQIFIALAAAGLATAATDPCKPSNGFTINSQADIQQLSSCKTLTGDVTIGTQTDATLDLSPFTEIDGDLTLLNNPDVTTLKSTSLTTITGAFHLQNLTTLSTLSFAKLTSVGSINWVSLTAIDVLTFTAGIKEAKSVVISDTFLSSLDGIDVASAETININNNRRLVEYTSSLGNLSNNLNINANGLDLAVSFPNLIWIANMSISNVSSFLCPSLAVVNGSMRFDSNFFKNFSAPNLTSTTAGDVSFVSNSDLTNISIPNLTSTGGGFLIANNTALESIDGFKSLKTVGGAIQLRGNFTDVEFPALNDVKGAFQLVSTADVTDACKVFDKLAPSHQGGGGQIQGTYTCTGHVANANNDTSSDGSGSSSGSGSSGSSSSTKSSSAAAPTAFYMNKMAYLGLGAAGVVAAQAL